MIGTFNQMYKKYKDKFSDDYVVMYFNEERLTKKQFIERTEQIKKHLILLGVRQGDGVGYTLNNGMDVIPLFFAIAELGAYAIPRFPGIPAMGRMKLFQKTKTSLIITNETMIDELKENAKKLDYDVKFAVVEKESNHTSIYGEPKEKVNLSQYYIVGKENELPLMIGTSSGTTGVPKMVCMTQENIGSEMLCVFHMLDNNIYPMEQDICGMAFPLSTSVILILCGSLLHGRTLIVSDDLTPMNFLRIIAKYKATNLSCPPAYYESLLLLKDKTNFDLSSVVKFGAGMDFFPVERMERIKKMFPNIREFTNGYGLVETCNIFSDASYDLTSDTFESSATLEMIEQAENIMKICDDGGKEVSTGESGELYVKGPNVVHGYMSISGESGEEFQDGWFHTGDIARKESDTKFTLLGRRKYFIKRGGKSISPIVVQTEINKTPGISDSGVVGVPHPLYGQMIWAFVVKDKNSPVSLKEIKQQCKKTLPYYMLPDQVTFVEKIPKNSGVGKVDFETLLKMGKKELENLKSYTY